MSARVNRTGSQHTSDLQRLCSESGSRLWRPQPGLHRCRARAKARPGARGRLGRPVEAVTMVVIPAGRSSGWGPHPGLLSSSSQELLRVGPAGGRGGPCMEVLTGPACAPRCPRSSARARPAMSMGSHQLRRPQPGSASHWPSHRARQASSCPLAQGAERALGFSVQRRGAIPPWDFPVAAPPRLFSEQPPSLEVFFPRVWGRSGARGVSHADGVLVAGGGGEPQGCSLEVLRAVSEMQVLRFYL